jgi:GDPmannose 4,6-dehydratase
MYACSGILFNHESPRRGHNFVTRKITIALGKILKGTQQELVLGNLDALRDWGHAKDFVYGMWQILQQDQPDDFVLSTSEYHSVREFVVKAFALKGITITWSGESVNEIGTDQNGRVLVRVSDKYFRPTEVCELLGNSSKAERAFGWKNKYSFDQLVQEMVDYDCV